MINTNYSIFFNSFSSSKSSNSTDYFGNMTSSLGDFQAIRSGNYKKLLKSYYAKKAEEESGTDTAKQTADNVTMQSADALVSSTKTLLDTGKNSVIAKGDTEKIASAVKTFVKDYNALIDSAAESDSKDVLRKTLYMTKNTSANSKMLAKVGITIGADNKLTLDETKLKKAEMSDIKTMFNSSGSYLSRTARYGSQVSAAAKTSSLYNQKGLHSARSYTGVYSILT